MKQVNETLPLKDLIAILQSLSKQRRTGTMFVHTDTNHSARIGMEQGRIFFIAYGRYRGMDAIEQIKKMQYGKYSFAESIFNGGAEIPLPTTSELLSELASAADEYPPGTITRDRLGNGILKSLSASGSAAHQANPSFAFSDLPLPASSGDFPSDDTPLGLSGERLCSLVEETLALSIGPVASVVCDDYRGRLESVDSPADYRTIIVEIASEVGERNESARFVARALAAARL